MGIGQFGGYKSVYGKVRKLTPIGYFILILERFMTIYQLHRKGGEYEDYYDWIIGTYLNKTKAETDRQILLDKQQEKVMEHNFCAECPIHEMSKRIWNNRKNEVVEYCKNSHIEYEGNAVWCSNEISHYHDDLDEEFEIKEVEVIE